MSGEIPIFFPPGEDEQVIFRDFRVPDEDPFRPRPLNDPFGFRKAVVPVFVQENNRLVTGIGTAFHIDHWGSMLTADHVIDFMRAPHEPWRSLAPREETFQPGDPHAFVLYGMGLIFGSVGIPPEAMGVALRLEALMIERDDPMASLRGEVSVQPAADVAHMRMPSPDPRYTATLPLRLRGWRPQEGDWVVALGFPELDVTPVSESDMHQLLSEGLHMAYGRLVAGHPKGTGRSNPGPVFEVEGHWPSGMSGGPVINRHGEVVGVVSRSIEPTSDERGVGYAAAFEYMPWLPRVLKTLDQDNPRWRRGWAVQDSATYNLHSFHRSEEEAAVALASSPANTTVKYGSAALDGSGFMSHRDQS